MLLNIEETKEFVWAGVSCLYDTASLQICQKRKQMEDGFKHGRGRKYGRGHLTSK